MKIIVGLLVASFLIGAGVGFSGREVREVPGPTVEVPGPTQLVTASPEIVTVTAAPQVVTPRVCADAIDELVRLLDDENTALTRVLEGKRATVGFTKADIKRAFDDAAACQAGVS